MDQHFPERRFLGGEIAIPSIHTVQRSAGALGTIVAMAGLFLAGLSSPTISATVGVTLGQGALVVGVFLGGVSLACLAYLRFGAESRVYRACDHFESFALAWGIAYLIQMSSAVHSFFWIFHGVQVLVTALAGYELLYLVTVCVGPAYLVAAFLWHGETASAWLSAIGGASGFFVYLVVARLSNQRGAALRREAALRQELGRILVARERSRISRDLHDNVTTELTALVWKVREISHAVPEGPHTLDMVGVSERLCSAIKDLRNVVLALRDPELDFPELALIVERRCRELCGSTELGLTIEGRVERDELSAFQDQILPICFELVSNAARHAQARRIELELRIAARVHIVVADDGRGLSPSVWQDSRGGLQSLGRRAQQLGGGVSLEVTTAGTVFAVDLPRPLRERSFETHIVEPRADGK